MNGGQLTLGETPWPTDAELREQDKRARAAAAVRSPLASAGPDLTPERAHARRSDPLTSHAAAASITPDQLRASHVAVLAVFRRVGAMHDERLLAAYADVTLLHGTIGPRQSPSGLRTRRRELVDLGLLRDSGERVTLPSGRRSIIWEQTTPGGHP